MGLEQMIAKGANEQQLVLSDFFNADGSMKPNILCFFETIITNYSNAWVYALNRKEIEKTVEHNSIDMEHLFYISDSLKHLPHYLCNDGYAYFTIDKNNIGVIDHPAQDKLNDIIVRIKLSCLQKITAPLPEFDVPSCIRNKTNIKFNGQYKDKRNFWGLSYDEMLTQSDSIEYFFVHAEFKSLTNQ